MTDPTDLHEALRLRLRDRGYTPPAAEMDALLDLVGEGDDDAVKAAVRVGAPLLPLARARYGRSSPPQRGRLLRLVARLGGNQPQVEEDLLTALADADPRTRRAAMTALGRSAPGDRSPGAEVGNDRRESALLEAWAREQEAPERRALVEALGKVGGAKSLAALRAFEAGEGRPSDDGAGDAELRRLLARAMLMLERTQGRPAKGDGPEGSDDAEGQGGIDGSRVPPEPLPVLLRCRAGLESWLADEATSAGLTSVVIAGPGLVRAVLSGPLHTIFGARTLLSFSFPLPPEPLPPDGDVAALVARAITAPGARVLFRTFASGPLRFRLAFGGGGHRRAVVWRCAEQVAKVWPELVNDPRQAPWEVTVHERRGTLDVELRPRGLADGRFAYRVADVPAASHPTLAAALALVGGVRPEDRVWDPFVGSGVELVERARLGPVLSLEGTDVDPAALAAARKNLAAAGVGATVGQGDARIHRPAGGAPTLILTNPPMGRRVVHHAELGALLQTFVEHGAELLAPGGRLVWLSPMGPRTARWARDAGLQLKLAQNVDMGGFTAQLQCFVKGGAARR